jgi:hypothetical protein
MFFTQTDNRDALLELVARRLSSPPDQPGSQPTWGLKNSYDVWLANEPKRKIAISTARNCWIAGVESKGVLDFAMLQSISEVLNCKVIACQFFGTTDAWGQACCLAGRLVGSMWNENEADPLNALRTGLQLSGVTHDLITFQEAIRLRSEGWSILERR